MEKPISNITESMKKFHDGRVQVEILDNLDQILILLKQMDKVLS